MRTLASRRDPRRQSNTRYRDIGRRHKYWQAGTQTNGYGSAGDRGAFSAPANRVAAAVRPCATCSEWHFDARADLQQDLGHGTREQRDLIGAARQQPEASVISPFLSGITPSVLRTYCRSWLPSPARLLDRISTPTCSEPRLTSRILTAPESCRRRNASRSG